MILPGPLADFVKHPQVCISLREFQLRQTAAATVSWTAEQRQQHRAACKSKGKLSLGQKLDIISLHQSRDPDQRKSQAQLANLYGKSRSAISKILRPENIAKLKNISDTGVHKGVKRYSHVLPQLEMEKRIHQMMVDKGSDRPLLSLVSGRTEVIAYAQKIALEAGVTDFRPTHGWYARFLKRHGLVHKGDEKRLTGDDGALQSAAAERASGHDASDEDDADEEHDDSDEDDAGTLLKGAMASTQRGRSCMGAVSTPASGRHSPVHRRSLEVFGGGASAYSGPWHAAAQEGAFLRAQADASQDLRTRRGEAGGSGGLDLREGAASKAAASSAAAAAAAAAAVAKAASYGMAAAATTAALDSLANKPTPGADVGRWLWGSGADLQATTTRREQVRVGDLLAKELQAIEDAYQHDIQQAHDKLKRDLVLQDQAFNAAAAASALFNLQKVAATNNFPVNLEWLGIDSSAIAGAHPVPVPDLPSSRLFSETMLEVDHAPHHAPLSAYLSCTAYRKPASLSSRLTSLLLPGMNGWLRQSALVCAGLGLAQPAYSQVKPLLVGRRHRDASPSTRALAH